MEDAIDRKQFVRQAGAVALSLSAAGALAGEAAGSVQSPTKYRAWQSKLQPYSGPFGGVQYPATTASLPTLVADQMGFFKNQRLNLANVVIGSSVDVARAIQLRQIAFGNAGILSTMSGFGAGLGEVRVIGLAEAAQGLIWLVKSDSSIKTLTDLKGKSLGLISNNKNLSYYLMQSALKGVGLDITTDVNITYFTSLPASLAAVLNGVIDCSISNKPPGSAAVASGQARVIWDSGVVKNLVSDGLFTSATFADTHPAVCTQFVTAFAQAQQWIRHNPDKAAALWAKATQLDVSICKAALQGAMLSGYQIQFTIPSFYAVRSAGVALGSVPSSLSYYAFVDPRFQKGLTKYQS